MGGGETKNDNSSNPKSKDAFPTLEMEYFCRSSLNWTLWTYLYLALSFCTTIQAWTCPPVRTRSPRTSLRLSAEKSFGRKEYWQEFYQNSSEDFSWYAEWKDLEPFIREWVDVQDRILLPGVGTDALMMNLYDENYRNLWAYDYASESIHYWESRLDASVKIDLQVADARDLPYSDEQFDVILDKGTFDAVYLAGHSSQERVAILEQALVELDRVLRPGGTFWSLSAICTDALQKSPTMSSWNKQADGSLYITAEGYTSNNLDGTLLVWSKPIE